MHWKGEEENDFDNFCRAQNGLILLHKFRQLVQGQQRDTSELFNANAGNEDAGTMQQVANGLLLDLQQKRNC